MKNKRNKRINNQEPLKIWIWSLTIILLLSVFSYGYFVRGTIVNIVARQNMESEFSVLSSKVLSLESEYIMIKDNINIELAHKLGFQSVINQKFVTRSIDNPSLSLVTPNI